MKLFWAPQTGVSRGLPIDVRWRKVQVRPLLFLHRAFRLVLGKLID